MHVCVGARVLLHKHSRVPTCIACVPCVCKFPARVCLWGWCVTKRLVGCHFLLLELDCPALFQAEPRVDEPD